MAKYLTLLICLLQPCWAGAQISKYLYECLDEDLRPVNRLKPTPQEVKTILMKYSPADTGKCRGEVYAFVGRYGASYKQIRDQKERLDFLRALEWFWHGGSQFDSTIKYANLGVAELQPNYHGYEYELSQQLKMRGFAQMYEGEFSSAFVDFQQAMSLLKSISRNDHLDDCYAGMMMIFQKLDLYDRIIASADTTVQLIDRYSSRTVDQKDANINFILLIKARALIARYIEGKKQSGAAAQTVLNEVLIDSKNQNWRILAFTELSRLSYFQGRYQMAVALADSAFKFYPIGSSTNMQENTRLIYKGLSLLKLGQRKQAEWLFSKVDTTANDIYAQEFYQQLYRYEKLEGDEGMALKYLERLQAVNLKRQLIQHRANLFELENKFNNISRDLQIQRIEAKRRQMYWALCIGAFFVVILAGFVAIRYRNNRLKTRSLVRQIEDLTQFQILKVREAEQRVKKKIASELHDDLSGSIAATASFLRLRGGREASAEVTMQFNRVSDTLEASYYRIRKMSHDLYNEESEHDFWKDLTEYINFFFSTTDLEANVYFEPEGLALSTEAKTAILMIIKECLTNILKHARASKVEVLMYQSMDSFTLEINDNGIGGHVRPNKSMGLQSIKDRAVSLGGELHIMDNKPTGTKISITVPAALFALGA
jgi:signal transduction histidine kinase